MKKCLMLLLVSISLFAFEADIISPVSTPKDINEVKASLGKRLFTDKRLSKDGTVSCASCHPGDVYGVDYRKTAEGIGGQTGTINTPTTFHSRYFFAQFHDGRATDLKDQALGPITNPIEMGNTVENMLQTLHNDRYYKIFFDKVYADGITLDNALDAIAEFEKTLVTPSRFDRYLKGDTDALSAREKKGYELFKAYGCIACHNGIAVGGNMYQKLGIFKAYEGSSLGRYNVTGDEADKNYFKVPTLRNVTQTFPYLHDGSVATITKAVKFMGRHQLGTKIEQKDVALIVEFLRTLTGVIPDAIKE